MPYSVPFLPGGETGDRRAARPVAPLRSPARTWTTPDDANQLIVGTPELWGTFDQGNAQNYHEVARRAPGPMMILPFFTVAV